MTISTVRAIRGASTCDVDEPDHVGVVTRELLNEMLGRNNVDLDDVISVFFTTTPDLISTFPASAARDIGFGTIPLMCASEIPVPGAKARVVRIMMHAYSELPRDQIRHVYLRDAQSLRDDLD